MQQMLRLLGAVVDRHAALKKVFAQVGEAYVELFEQGTRSRGVQLLERGLAIPRAHFGTLSLAATRR